MMTINTEFRKQVKSVLEHLYDTAYLEAHPLLPQIILADSTNRITRAQKLRSLIKDLIESLRPHDGSPSNSPEWRSYRALRYHYVQGMSMRQVESELGISLRQLQREFHKGIDAIAILLWQQRKDQLESPETAVEVDEVEELQEELNQWAFERRACELCVLFDDLHWMLEPLLEQQQVEIQIDLPADLPVVMIDVTLTRQAIFSLIRQAVQEASKSVHITALPSERTVDLLIHLDGPALNMLEPDWRMVEMLITRQGGSLDLGHADETTEIQVSLPRPEQGTVLVIDDNQALHNLFERYLVPVRYTVMHAYNGVEGLQLAEEKQPDFITLDVMMAAMDGWQVLRELQSNPATAHIRVIVCSVLKEPELALSLGAKAYLKKPVERLQLQKVLEDLKQIESDPVEGPPE
jgi:CheY-like chemotaxis protein